MPRISHSPSSTSFQGTLESYFGKTGSANDSQRRLTQGATSVMQQQSSQETNGQKRKILDSDSVASVPKKFKRSSKGYAPPSKYDHIVNKLTDSLAPNLICLFIGLNPGIRTATTGHAYNHPTNLFWKLLHSSGCTPRPCRAEEDGDMPRLFNLGFTNIVSRATKDGSELSNEEMDEGVAVLEMKIAAQKPEAVAIVGKSIWESIWRVRHRKKITKNEFKYGWQDERENMGKSKEKDLAWKGAKVFVATTTSGLAAGMGRQEKEEVWRGLGEWVEKRRAERADTTAGENADCEDK
ncbi:MAG: hypothetical protein Q9190_006245 [Brigantiaea leucoxantha]